MPEIVCFVSYGVVLFMFGEYVVVFEGFIQVQKLIPRYLGQAMVLCSVDSCGNQIFIENEKGTVPTPLGVEYQMVSLFGLD